ncbi:hypothetical protein ACUARK_005223, partial [Escherichia coli]
TITYLSDTGCLEIQGASLVCSSFILSLNGKELSGNYFCAFIFFIYHTMLSLLFIVFMLSVLSV